MEDRLRPHPLTSTNPGWLVSPAFDLLFLANVGWLVALVPGYLSTGGTPYIAFWQLHFVTTPHRWLTLVLVALDPDRRAGRPKLMLTFAFVGCVLVGGVYFCAGDFICLFVIDYLWNGWHFASQHAGVLRIYSRRAGEPNSGVRAWMERHGLRLVLCYIIARTAGWSVGWLEGYSTGASILSGLDVAALALTLVIFAFGLSSRPFPLAKAAYLSSVCGLYGMLLVSLSLNLRSLVLSLTTAAALFHATEYIALICRYTWGRRQEGSAGLFRTVAIHSTQIIAVYLLGLGLFTAYLHHNGEPPSWWIGLNLWAALLHYTYDGLIWKLRQPLTARALGAEPTG